MSDNGLCLGANTVERGIIGPCTRKPGCLPSDGHDHDRAYNEGHAQL